MLIDLLDPPIAYHRVYRRITGNTVGAIMLSQLTYWQHIVDEGRGGINGWIYKTIEEMEKETGLSRHEQMTARKCLKKLNIIDEKKEGLPCKLFYRVNRDELEKLLLLQCNSCAYPDAKPKNKNDEKKYIEAAIRAADPDDAVAYAATVRRRIKKQGGLSTADQQQLAAWEQDSKSAPQIKAGDVIDYGNFRQQIEEIRGNCVETQSGEILPIGPIITSIISGKAKLLSHS